MARAETAASQPLDYAGPLVHPDRQILRRLLFLAAPILAENVLHMLVGLTDVYVAGHLPPQHSAAATAAVGSIAYILWLVGLIVATIGTGTTAVIARAVGARHRSLANSVCGQTASAAAVLGLCLGVAAFLGAGVVARATGLTGQAQEYAFFYLRVLAISLPFSTFLFAANAALRGAGDTVTPALSMILVDGLNALLSISLARGWWGLPEMGFQGIAIGTMIAYITGGVVQFFVLLRGRGGVRLHLHRLRPHWHTLRRILRIGVPSGAEGMITWLAQFAIVVLINRLDASHVASSAHIITIRLESLSFMGGFAIATAAATMVGQSLGMRDPARASRSAYLAFLLGGGLMAAWGVAYILFPTPLSRLLSNDPRVIELAARCLFIAGFAQIGFAASMVFGGALRGAGDTWSVMLINLASVLVLRLLGVLIVLFYFRLGLAAIWIVLSAELVIRGILIYARFLKGDWKQVEV